MDGIARNTNGFDADLTSALVPVLTAAILVVVGIFAIALSAELLRRAGAASDVVRHLDRIVPTPARRIAAATLSLSVTLLGPPAASASDAPVRDWLSATTTTTSPVATEESLIERTTPPTAAAALPPPPPTGPPPSTTAPEPAPAATPPEPLPDIEQLVVVEGDCLWAIAARRLEPDATNAAIDRAWRAIYALNRAAVGDDPNLIFPGLQLTLPPIDPMPSAAP